MMLFEKLLRFLKPPALSKNSNPRIFKCDGVTAFWFDYDRMRVSGWATARPERGDLLLSQMQSGKTAVFEFVSVDYMRDPPDQYFATVKGVGYA